MSERQRSFGNNVDLDVAQPTPEAAEQAEGWPGKRPLTDALAQSSGAALPGDLQRALEASLGADLGGVRVHTDGAAEQAAAGLHAKAFTIGQAVYFNRGYFDPASASGRQLLAHEVAHTVQQRGATTGGPLAVSRPGDAHEAQAEAFASTFAKAPGARAAAMTPISRGVIARAVIQRDLLEGGVPALAPAPLTLRVPTPAELQQQAQTAIRNARATGVNSVVAIVARLRGNATGVARAAFEAAIEAELTAQEKQALGGGPAAAPPPATSPPATSPQAVDTGATAASRGGGGGASGGGAGGGGGSTGLDAATSGAGGGGGVTNGLATSGAEGGPGATTTVAGPVGGSGTSGPAAATSSSEGDPGASTSAKGAAPQPADQPGTSRGKATESADGGVTDAEIGVAGGVPDPSASGGGVTRSGAGEPGAEIGVSGGVELPIQSTTTAPMALTPPAAPREASEVSDLQGRPLIEAELSFHERWAAMSSLNGAGRAGRLVGGLLNETVGDGMKDGLTQFAFGKGTELFATKMPFVKNIPGVGNIIGGGLAAFNLFSNGGHGIRSMGSDIAKGVSGAFAPGAWDANNRWLTAANLVSSIKTTLELVSNICQIVSGLAYGLAAIGALASLACPALIPLIPTVLNFGRLCGGIATVCMGIANLLSPIPPVLRAIHIITSNNDPIQLVNQEKKFHDDAKGAVANYTSNRLSNAGKGKGGFFKSTVGDIKDGASIVRTSWNSGARAGTGTSLGLSKEEMNKDNRVSKERAREFRKDYFDPKGRADALAMRGASAEDDLTHAQGAKAVQEEQLGRAQTTNKQGVLRGRIAAQNERIKGAQNELATVNQATPFAGNHNQDGLQGNAGDLGGAASLRGKAAREDQQADEGKQLATEVGAPAAPNRSVPLPAPPGSLSAIDQLDDHIKQMEWDARSLQGTGAQARAQQQESSQIASGLQSSAQNVTQYVQGQQERGAASQQRVTAQTTDVQGRAAQAQQAGGKTQGATLAFMGVAAIARGIHWSLMKLPENPVFDVKPARTNVGQFVAGMDSIMGANPKQQEHAQQQQAAIGARNQQQQEAASANTSGVQVGSQVATMMNADAATAAQISSASASIASSSAERAIYARERLEQLRAQRKQKWGALVSWAADHRNLREQAEQADPS